MVQLCSMCVLELCALIMIFALSVTLTKVNSREQIFIRD